MRKVKDLAAMKCEQLIKKIYYLPFWKLKLKLLVYICKQDIKSDAKPIIIAMVPTQISLHDLELSYNTRNSLAPSIY